MSCCAISYCIILYSFIIPFWYIIFKIIEFQRSLSLLQKQRLTRRSAACTGGVVPSYSPGATWTCWYWWRGGAPGRVSSIAVHLETHGPCSCRQTQLAAHANLMSGDFGLTTRVASASRLNFRVVLCWPIRHHTGRIIQDFSNQEKVSQSLFQLWFWIVVWHQTQKKYRSFSALVELSAIIG